MAEQGQITDRYARSVEQIGRHGAENLQVRLGGIYALERLARDSPRDQPTIVEVLSAFIRTTLPKPDDDGKCPRLALPADIEAAFTVLGRREHAHDGGTARTDIHGTCMADADLSGADLSGAYLSGANLTEANLTEANLTEANLTEANLTEANLLGADLSGADLSGADLSGANLSGADLSGAKLSGADLAGAYLFGAYLSGADLFVANLFGADLSGANLSGANLFGANLSDANLSSADLSSADLRGAHHDNRTIVEEVRTDDRTIGVWW